MAGETALIRQRLREIPQYKQLKPTQRRFLSAVLASNCYVTKASELSGVNWRNHYNWLENPAYKQAFEITTQIWSDTLLGDMCSDAIEGQTKPIVFKGEITGYFKEKNTREREVLLKGFKPEFRDNYNPLGSAGPGLVNITLNQSPPQPVVAAVDITPTKPAKS